MLCLITGCSRKFDISPRHLLSIVMSLSQIDAISNRYHGIMTTISDIDHRDRFSFHSTCRAKCRVGH